MDVSTLLLPCLHVLQLGDQGPQQQAEGTVNTSSQDYMSMTGEMLYSTDCLFIKMQNAKIQS